MPLAAQIALHGSPSLRLQGLQCSGKQTCLFVQGTGAIGQEETVESCLLKVRSVADSGHP